VVKELCGPLYVKGDADKLKQAMINIISNSYQAMDGQGTIKIVTRRDNNKAVVIVEDTGPGISETDIDRIFDPFFTTKSMGNGLGLSITKKMVEEHGGRISVSSQVGKGAVFALSFDAVNGTDNKKEEQTRLWN
jgi:signal transduction histidine kinase